MIRLPTAPRQWPDHAKAHRDETHALAEDTKRIAEEAQAETDPNRRKWLLAEVKANQERIARLMELSGAR